MYLFHNFSLYVPYSILIGIAVQLTRLFSLFENCECRTNLICLFRKAGKCLKCETWFHFITVFLLFYLQIYLESERTLILDTPSGSGSNKLQGPPTHIDAFQTNIFSWFNDTVIKSQWFLGSWDKEIWYKTLFFHFINVQWPPRPQKEKI